ncbi:MAG: PepSY-like domain-containing protein [Saprospiraceae bacterium]|nr:PepSY-like domain-containing protein [Saprospiraceae bacterium]
MKNLIYGMLAMGIMALAFACQKETTDATANLINAIAGSDSKQAVSVSELPTEVREYVALSFTPVEIEAAWHVSGKGYEVELEDGQDLYFRDGGDCMGTSNGGGGGVFRCMRGDTVDVSELPQAAADYIAANYGSLTILTVVYKSHDNHTGYAVELSDGTILLFNGDGEFVNLCGEFPGGGDGNGHGDHGGDHDGDHGNHGGDHGPDGPQGGCAAGDTIDVADLPTAVTDYITANYSGETINIAVVKPSGKFGVELASGTVLLFDADGNFIKICDGQPGHGGTHQHHCDTELTALTDLPQAAQDYIATNYPGETLDHGCVKNNGNFFVELSNDAKILFDADGNVVFDSGN